ncbi:unnamed protein product, partial [Effrenium voratum]
MKVTEIYHDLNVGTIGAPTAVLSDTPCSGAVLTPGIKVSMPTDAMLEEFLLFTGCNAIYRSRIFIRHFNIKLRQRMIFLLFIKGLKEKIR